MHFCSFSHFGYQNGIWDVFEIVTTCFRGTASLENTHRFFFSVVPKLTELLANFCFENEVQYEVEWGGEGCLLFKRNDN